MMAHEYTVHLDQGQVERLARLADDGGRNQAELLAQVIEEGLRVAEHPLITFRESIVGRQAYVQGTSLAVWEVVMVASGYGNDAEATANHLEWPVNRIEAALRYASAYPNEVNAALADNEAQLTLAVDANE